MTSLMVKLGSIAVHVEEKMGPLGHQFDEIALKQLLQDSEVRAFLDDPKNAAFFPVKRTMTDFKMSISRDAKRVMKIKKGMKGKDT